MNSQFHHFIPLVSYPEKEIIAAMDKLNFKKPSELKGFLDFVHETDICTLQERFTQTFDMSPTTCLDLGWHLYGEAYERGAFMVKIRELLRNQGISETSELPDHLTHILAILPGLSDKDRVAFIKKYIQPALTKILEGFGDTENPYKIAIQYLSDRFQDIISLNGGEN
jgi:nitrate reductase delta subunit